MSRGGLWLMRFAGIGLLSLMHFGVLMSVTVASLGGLLSRGPGGEELGDVYRESEAGRRHAVVSEVLSWPIIKPVTMIERQLSAGTIRSTPWRVITAAGFYANSVAWGIGLWVLLEMLARGVYRALSMGRADPPTPASDDTSSSR